LWQIDQDRTSRKRVRTARSGALGRTQKLCVQRATCRLPPAPSWHEKNPRQYHRFAGLPGITWSGISGTNCLVGTDYGASPTDPGGFPALRR